MFNLKRCFPIVSDKLDLDFSLVGVGARFESAAGGSSSNYSENSILLCINADSETGREFSQVHRKTLHKPLVGSQRAALVVQQCSLLIDQHMRPFDRAPLRLFMINLKPTNSFSSWTWIFLSGKLFFYKLFQERIRSCNPSAFNLEIIFDEHTFFRGTNLDRLFIFSSKLKIKIKEPASNYSAWVWVFAVAENLGFREIIGIFLGILYDLVR